MSGFLDFAAQKNCYATAWSYGEICVHSNCCGQFDKSKKAMLKARIAYHKDLLDDRMRFTAWSDEPKMLKLQKKNIKADIAYHRKMLKRLRAGSLRKG
jgi:hypothetical protein